MFSLVSAQAVDCHGAQAALAGLTFEISLQAGHTQLIT